MNGLNVNPNERESQTQNKQILRALKNGERITQLDALNQFGCFRLSARIYDLRQDGNNIQAEMITMPNGKRVKQYFMEAV